MFQETNLIEQQIKQQFEDYCSSLAENRYSLRIKPSTLGGDCLRENFFKWRWAKKPTTSGKKQRRFQRGDREENEIIKLLIGLGFDVDCVDPARIHKDRKQYKITARQGHVTGFMDGVIRHKLYFGGAWGLGEAKAINAKRFATVQRHGVEKAEPIYYSQVIYYLGANPSLEWCLFVYLNTNDDEIDFKIIMPNQAKYEQLLRNEEAIYTARMRPARIAETPAFHRCKHFCDFTDICHRGAPVDINCRSCLNCFPVDNGRFECALHGPIPSLEALLEGCGQHKPI